MIEPKRVGILISVPLLRTAELQFATRHCPPREVRAAARTLSWRISRRDSAGTGRRAVCVEPIAKPKARPDGRDSLPRVAAVLAPPEGTVVSRANILRPEDGSIATARTESARQRHVCPRLAGVASQPEPDARPGHNGVVVGRIDCLRTPPGWREKLFFAIGLRAMASKAARSTSPDSARKRESWSGRSRVTCGMGVVARIRAAPNVALHSARWH